MASIGQTGEHWRDVLIERAEVISDAWQVFLAYAGRAAQIVLFLCMIITIIEMFPGATGAHGWMWAWLPNFTLLIQMVTLDVAGFGLSSMAKHIRRGGDTETAEKAEKTSTALIAIMMVSLLSVAVKLLFGTIVVNGIAVSDVVTGVDDVLIMVRIVATVYYGHIINELSDVKQYMQVQAKAKDTDLQNEVVRLQGILQTERKAHQDKITDLQGQISLIQQSANAALTTTSNQGDLVGSLQNQVNRLQNQLNLQSAKTDEVTAKLQNSTSLLQSAEQRIAVLQNQIESAKLQSGKSAKPTTNNVTPIDDLRAKHEAKTNGKAKVTDEEILAFIAANPSLTVKDVAAKLEISERKIYLAKQGKSANSDENADAVGQ